MGCTRDYSGGNGRPLGHGWAMGLTSGVRMLENGRDGTPLKGSTDLGEGSMLRPYLYRQGKGWCWGILANLFITLTLWQPASSQEDKRTLGATYPGHVNRPPYVAVHQGQLFVDLEEALIEPVLAQIGQQAGFSITVSSGLERRVSAHFTGVTLEAGLRRLLRMASLSSIMQYARNPMGAVVLTGVRVLEAGTGEDSPRTTIAEQVDIRGREDEAAQRFLEAFTQAGGGFSQAVGARENDTAQRFRAILEGAPQETSPLATGEQTELARRFQEVLVRTSHHDSGLLPLMVSPNTSLHGFAR
jgi:hypothetical protein